MSNAGKSGVLAYESHKSQVLSDNFDEDDSSSDNGLQIEQKDTSVHLKTDSTQPKVEKYDEEEEQLKDSMVEPMSMDEIDID